MTLNHYQIWMLTLILCALVTMWLFGSKSKKSSTTTSTTSTLSTVGAKVKGLGHFISHHWGKLLWILTLALLWWGIPIIVEAIKSRPAPPPPIVDETRRLWNAEIILQNGERKELSNHDARILQNNSAGFKAIYPLDGGICVINQDYIPRGEGSWECTKYGKVVAKGGITISPNQTGDTIIGQMWDIQPIKDVGPYIVKFKALNRWWDGR